LRIKGQKREGAAHSTVTGEKIVNMLSRLSQVLNAAEDSNPNGAALIGFYGRNMNRSHSRAPQQPSHDRRVRQVA